MSGLWIVMRGTLLDTTEGGGFEFIGPFMSERAAIYYCAGQDVPDGHICQVVELLSPGNKTSFPLDSIEEIVNYLNLQANGRAEENDEAGVLLQAAEYIETTVKEL